ncbi:Gfo/Idh/MocA family oxidoreductase [Litorilinea aerophila]|uniref:Gfo/Idh/MocA family protein n=1 Tax=Litorilinea aerophila TaxID=1204385 RepID=UPI001B85CDF0|nr:Gfo/Idh/MocA family oxidoreductase [Litorilinea aerophila]MCC9078485.1 Gfo/Idh/MocA family oxidoreductase [Litorilinea aerophila]GIV80072.1 MAG: dehydrogenase [Litorilinea sp.]
MNGPTLRIGMMSFAHGHANSYAACLQQVPGVTLAGIYDTEPQRGQDAARRLDVPFYATADELLDQGLDGVIVCSENANHRPMVEAAAGRVGHILCEKPIATTLADAQAMIDRCQATGTALQIAFPVRFAPPAQHLREVLRRGELGQVYSVQCTNHGRMPGGWFTDPALAGGGAVIDHTVHVIDLLRWFWETEVVEVYAEVGRGLLHPELAIDDAGLLSFTLANGVYGTLDTSWSRPPSYPTWGDVKIEVVAEKGALVVDVFQQVLAVSSEQWGQTRWIPWGSNMDLGLIQDFVACIREGRPPSITGHDGRQALEVALAAYHSAELGRPVRLPLAAEAT